MTDATSGHVPAAAGHPRTAKARAALRALHRHRILVEAEREAAAYSLSLNCRGVNDWAAPRHAGAEGGCRNDGSTCLCACHDDTCGKPGEYWPTGNLRIDLEPCDRQPGHAGRCNWKLPDGLPADIPPPAEETP